MVSIKGEPEVERSDDEVKEGLVAAQDHPFSDSGEGHMITPTQPEKEYLWHIGNFSFGRYWMGVAGACVTMIGLGVFVSFGTLSIYLSDPGLLLGSPNTLTIWIYATGSAVLPCVMFVASSLQKRFGFMTTSIVGAVLAASGLALSSLATKMWMMALSFGFLLGSGIGLSYGSCVVTAQKLFPKHKGTASGIVLASFGSGSFLFNFIIQALANPNGITTKKPTDPEAVEAWRQLYHSEMVSHVPSMFLVLAAVTATLSITGSLALHPPKEEEKVSQASEKGSAKGQEDGVDLSRKKATSEQEEDLVIEMPTTKVTVKTDFTPKEMLKTIQFWLLYVMAVLSISPAVLVLGSFAEFAKREAQFEPPFALIGGLAALANAVGRITWGKVSDYLDYRRVYSIIIASLCVLLVTYFESRRHVAFYGIWTSLIFFCYGGLLSLLPVTASEAFGTVHVSMNYALIYSSTAIASILQAVLLNTLLEMLGGSFQFLFWISSGMLFLSEVLILAFHPVGKGKWFSMSSYKN